MAATPPSAFCGRMLSQRVGFHSPRRVKFGNVPENALDLRLRQRALPRRAASCLACCGTAAKTVADSRFIAGLAWLGLRLIRRHLAGRTRFGDSWSYSTRLCGYPVALSGSRATSRITSADYSTNASTTSLGITPARWPSASSRVTASRPTGPKPAPIDLAFISTNWFGFRTL